MQSIEQEQVIVENCVAGDLSEFEKLYDKYLQSVYRFVYYKTFHKQTAEDITSQTFLKAIDGIAGYDSSKASFSTWLFTIARNLVIDHYRTKKDVGDLADIWDMENGDDIQAQIENKDRLEQVKKYLKDIPGEHREVIILRVWNQLSYRDIALITGKTEAGCKMMFMRAMNKLRGNFSEKLAALIFLIVNSIRHG